MLGFFTYGNPIKNEQAIAASPDGYVALNPTRITDTRPGAAIDDSGPDPKGIRLDGSLLQVPIVGRGGVPVDASGVVINLASVGSVEPGHLVVYGCDSPMPNTANLNLQVGQPVSNLVMSKLGPNGDICIFNRGATHVVVDIYGYIPEGGGPTLIPPKRFADTRDGKSTDVDGADSNGADAQQRLEDGATLEVKVAGLGGVPTDASGVVINLAATQSTAPGHVVVYACGAERPSTANLNLQPGETVANLVMSKIGTDGSICLYVRGSTELVVDVSGYVEPQGNPVLVRPTRITDTREQYSIDDDVSDPKGLRRDGSILRVPVSGRGRVPADASGVVLNLATVGATAPGHVTVFACGTKQPSTANLNLKPGAAVSNMVISKLGLAGDVCVYTRGTTHLVIDIFGYISGTQVLPPTTTTIAPSTTTTTTSTTSTTSPTTSTTTTTTIQTSTTTTTPTTSTTSTTSPTTSTTTTTTLPPIGIPGEFERRFRVPPMGTARYHTELYESAIPAASRLEPVGLYLDEGDVVHMTVSGAVNLFAQVGMNGDGPIERIPLGDGLNQIVAGNEGALFLSNESTETTAHVTVNAAPEIKTIPTFRLYESHEAEFQAEVEAATDVDKIFLVGKYFMTYANRELYLAQNYITKTTPIIESPVAYLKKRDADIRTYHVFAGKDESVNNANANSFQQSREYVSTSKSGYMDARGGYINMNGTSPGVMARLFDEDLVDSGKGAAYSSGPWHELGHHQQLYLMAFPNAGEGAPNIYAGLLNLHAGHNYGIAGRDYLPADVYAAADAPADATGLRFYHMHYMYMQLFAAFGEGFYGRLHHLYRLVDNETAANTRGYDEMSLFAYLASKAAEEDLTPFFQSWKMPINAEYASKIAALNLPRPSGDLSARRLSEIKSPADMEGKYERKIAPYTNLPVADAKSDFMFRWGLTVSPYDLISYDPAVVAKAEFLNPNEEPFKVATSGKGYGSTMVEILLTGRDGQQNVVIATGMIKPESWGSYSTHASVIDQVTSYVNSAAFQSGNIDRAEAEMNLEMLEGTIATDKADLTRQLYAAITNIDRQAHGTPLHDAYFYSLSDANTFLYNGRPAVRVNAQQWQDIIDHGQLVIRAYETTPKTNPYLGMIRNGVTTPDSSSLNMLDFDVVGSDVIVYLTSPFGAPIQYADGRTGTLNTVRFEFWHRNVKNAWNHVDAITDATRVGATDRIDGHWVDAQFRADMTYLEYGDKNRVVIFSLPENAWNTMKAAGAIRLDFYRNGSKVGWTDGTTYKGVRVVLQNGVVKIRTPNPGLVAGDVFEMKGTFTSATSADLNGRIYLKMTANMLSPDLPVQHG